jgi:DNA-directed RNA polymerase specialized sigma24 family protein
MLSLTRAAEAYAAGDSRKGDRLFGPAYMATLPLVRAVTLRHVRGTDVGHDDAIQLAMFRVWQALRSGRVPDVKRYAAGAAIDLWRKEARQLDTDPIDERAETTPAPTEPEPDAQPVELVAPYAPDRWRDIADLAEAGWGQNEIALKLGVAQPTLRRIATEIRHDYHLRRSVAA